jgi:hypothetical protein
MGATTHLFSRPAVTGSAASRKRSADPTMTPDHLGVVRVNSSWIVHSLLEDDPAVGRPTAIRRLAGRR